MKKILIVDDSKDIVTSLVDFLEEEDYVVEYAYDAFSALEIVKKSIPDLIICDLIMPGMSGYDYYHEMKKNRETEKIPFIFITAAADRNEIQRGKNEGIRYFVIKPYNIIDLLKTIKTVLKD